MIISKEGKIFVYPLFGATALLIWIYLAYGINIFFPLTMGFFFLFCLNFFRDPKRLLPMGDNLIVSPADGKIIRLEAVNDEEISEALELKSVLAKSIDEMELSVRSHNCLQAAGIRTIGSLVSKEESVMLKFKNFGRKSLTELQEKLGELNLSFGMDIAQYLDA